MYIFSLLLSVFQYIYSNIQCVVMQKHKKIITKVIPLNVKNSLYREQQQFDLILCMIESNEFYKI